MTLIAITIDELNNKYHPSTSELPSIFVMPSIKCIDKMVHIVTSSQIVTKISACGNAAL